MDDQLRKLDVRMGRLEARMDKLDSRMDGLEVRMHGFDERMDRLAGDVKQQGILIRAMARVILPEDMLARALCDDAPKEIAVLKRKMSTL